MGAFSVFGGKKQKTVDGKSYYHRISVYFALAKYLCLIMVLATLLYGVSFRTDEINADNFRYLLSFLGDGESETKTYSPVYYDNNETNRFALVRGDLAVVSNSGVAVYGLSGVRRSVDTSFKMDEPEVLSSAKYMYIYDLGGTEVVVKSTLETVQILSYDFPLRAAAATDNGYFAAVSEKKTSRSTVFVYDDSLREVYNCSYSSLYTLSVDLNSDASRLVTASVEAEGGEFVTTLYLYSLTEQEPLVKETVTGEYPYRVSFGEGGEIVLLTDKCCRFYDKDGKIVSTLEFGEEGISGYDLGDRYFIRKYPLSTLSAAVRLEAYSLADGSLVWTKDFEQGLRLAKNHGGYLFCATEKSLTVMDMEKGEERLADTEEAVTELLPVEEGKVLLLTEGIGSVFNYRELFELKGENSDGNDN